MPQFCTKASPQDGRVRTSWPIFAEQTSLSPGHVEKLCRSLRRKGYIGYPEHRGKRRLLVEVVIDKFPLTDGTYTSLRRRKSKDPEEVLAEAPSDVSAEVPADLGAQMLDESRTSSAGRSRRRERSRSALGVVASTGSFQP